MDYTSLIKEVNIPELVKALRTMRMAREDIENSLKVLSHIVDDDFVITVDEARKIIGIDGEIIEALQAEVEQKNRDIAVLQKCYQIADEAVDKALEPKRGEWVKGADGLYHCSNCGTTAPYLDAFDGAIQYWENLNYCHVCGADMRKMEVLDG